MYRQYSDSVMELAMMLKPAPLRLKKKGDPVERDPTDQSVGCTHCPLTDMQTVELKKSCTTARKDWHCTMSSALILDANRVSYVSPQKQNVERKRKT